MQGKNTKEREVSCLICNSKFITTHSQGKYCSPPCQREAWRGHWRGYSQRNRKKRRAATNASYKKNREKRLAQIKHYKKSNPEKTKARWTVHNHLRNGRLKRLPCQKCGAKKVHAHHHDYSKPLDVIWLCALCHSREHHEVKG